ncbi:MAG TPA: response regulator transcription factor [Candidatus Acidoferrales bacterium]|nr:response regulator transcription factor [Candidatus Dormibacteraeota bacterium]HEX2715439.1 response regulator transcription factor [Candidatus Acidoferrales bacterium]
MATVLALDRDPLQLELIDFLLRRERHRVHRSTEPDSAFELLQTESVDMVLLDTVFPRHDGYRVCHQIRQLLPQIPLMIVSERSEEDQVVRGLLAGADDYLVKPYSPRILLARIQVLLRRSTAIRVHTGQGDQIAIGEVALSMHRMVAIVNGRTVTLTPRELSLLHALMSNANRVLNRDQLIRLAWGDPFAGGPKTVDVCIQRIRQKLEPHLLGGRYIRAIRGFGYTFEKPRAHYGHPNGHMTSPITSAVLLPSVTSS